MSGYLKTMILYLAMFVMVFTIASFSRYYSNVSSMKQDTYKEFMYSGMNKSALRLNGSEPLYNGDFDAYYLDDDGQYTQLNYEIIKHLSLSSNVTTSLDYELVVNRTTKEYYVHIKSDDVDTVLKFKMEEGDL